MPSESHHHLHSNTHNHHLSCNSTGMLQISEHNKKRKWKTTNHHHHHSSPVDNLQHHFRFLLHFIILLATLPITTQQSYDGVIITQSDLQGLQAFKSSIIDTKGYLRSWNDSGFSACSGGWAGIKCAQGQVIVIQLPWKGFRGKITDKIGQLQALRKLSLHDNQIAGSIPPSIGLLPNLRGLQLFNNRLTGSIPLTLGLCPLLQTLDLSNNALTGSIPATLANSTKLYWLNLSSNSLSGSIPTTLTTSKTLTLLAIQHNNLTGSIPTTIDQLTSIRYLDFSHNTMDGQLPDAIGRLHNLSLLNLRGNHINGTIPSSIGNISALKTLDLSHNQFNGHIPVSISNLPRLGEFNVSYNNLSGPVPVALSNKFNSSSFIGNLKLCGYSPNAPLCPSEIAPSPVVIPAVPSPDEETDNNHHHRKLSTKDIIIIVAGALLLMLLILCCILLCCLIKKRSSATTAKSKSGGAAAAGTGGATARGVEKGGTSGSAGGVEVETSGEAGGKLVHFEGMLVFTADDLLCATAEIMGKSTYGTVYKATLEDGSQVAVKRLREKITKGQKEFESEVNVLGKIRHPNLLALRAYYLGPKGEKLLVFDYIVKGSLANFLHAREPEVQIDWGIRMKIIKGTTRGLSYLHNQANIIHGNLTSSNVLIDEDNNAKISDYGLSRLTTGGASTNVIAAAGALGYRAPELSKLKKANTKTDVYSLGVIILELLTGKSPGEAVAGGGGVDLPQWVASIVKEEWTNEVFDVELMKDASLIGDELLNTLKLALHCVDPTPTARPEAKQVLQQLEEIIRTEGGGGTTSSGDDGGIGPSAASD